MGQGQGLPSKWQTLPVLTSSEEAGHQQQIGIQEAGLRQEREFKFLDMKSGKALVLPSGRGRSCFTGEGELGLS